MKFLHIHHWLRQLRKVKTWHLVVLLIVLAVASVLLLRQNNLGMVERRNVVKMTDEQNGDVKTALVDLQNYVSGHMNTNMGQNGVYLEKTYQRAYERAIQEATAQHTPTGAAYQQAEQECRVRSPAFQVFVQCVADKVGNTAPGQDPLAAIKTPPTDLYRHNFTSPVWSPDLAGLTLLAAVAVALLLAVRIASRWVLHGMLKRHHQ